MKRTTEKIFAAGLGLVMVLAQFGCKAGPAAEPSRSFGPDEVHTDIPDLCSVVASKDGKSVRSAKEVELDDTVDIRFVDGVIKTKVIKKEN